MIKQSEPKVFLIRHGSTDFNGESGLSEDRIRGWLDVPLNVKGKEDAHKAAKKLAKEHPEMIYSSDLVRAFETAQIIDKQFHVPIVKSNHLRPWNLGAMQGKYTKDILHELNDMIKFEHKIPKDGESFKTFRVRFLSELQKIVNQAKKDNSTIFITTHYRNLKTCDAWVQKGMPLDFSVDVETMLSDSFKPGEIYEFPMKKE